MSYCEDIFERSLHEVLSSSVKFLRNYRPDWLVNCKTGYNLEYDFYIPDYKVAFEIQGPHHYDSADQIERDTLKKELSEKNGVVLFCLSIFQVRPNIIRNKLKALSFSKCFKITLRSYNKIAYDGINQEINQYADTIKNKFGHNKCQIPPHLNNVRDGKDKARTYIGSIARISYKGSVVICEVLGESNNGVYLILKIGGRIRDVGHTKFLRMIVV